MTVPAGHGSIATMLLADDQHVFIDDRPEPLTFAPPRPGRCARLATGRWLPVGALRVARIAGFTLGDEETENVGQLLVCDPATGRLSRVETERNDGLRYCGTRLTFERAAVSGPWLLLERHRRQDGAACFGEEYRTTIVDTRTGSVETAAGGLSGPGVHAPEPDRSSGPPPSPEGLDASGAWPAVVLAPGVLAWAAGGEAPSAGSSRHPVVLADAAGTRRVGTATAASLGIDSGLRWTEDGVPRTAALAPAAGWAPAIASLEGL